MKKIITCLLLITSSLTANAQATGIAEDFNGACTSGLPLHWLPFNPISSTIPDGQWACAAGEGRYGTNGVKCTGVWGSPHTYHLDTSYLISPALNFSADTGHVYIYFDTKVSNINLGARLSFYVTDDSTKLDSASGTTDISGELLPVFGNGDSTDWVTHVADLTAFKGSVPLYVAFRYTSSTSTGSTWYIDNVHKSIFPAGVRDPGKEALALHVIGNSTSSTITLSCETGSPGQYNLVIYDLMGRQVHQEELVLQNTKTTHTMHGLSLTPGIYLIKMTNGMACITAKTIVQ